MDIQFRPNFKEDRDRDKDKKKDKKDNIVERVIEKETVVEVEKPIIIEKEKIVTVPEFKTEQFYKLVAESNSSLEKTKEMIKETMDQIKYIASDPNKLKNIENILLDKSTETSKNINSIKAEFDKNLGSLLVKIEELKSYIDRNKLPFQDPTGILNTINTTVAGLKIDLGTLSKLSDIQQYLSVLKTSVDKIEVRPVVNVNTQKIEDENTRKAVEMFSDSMRIFKEVLERKMKSFEERIITLEALVQPAIPLLKEKMDKTIEAHIDIGNSLASEVISKFDSLQIDKKILSSISSNLQSISEVNKNQIDDQYKVLNENIKVYFNDAQVIMERVINQKIFDLTLQLEKTISELVQKEFSSYLSNLKIDIIPEIKVEQETKEQDILSFLGSIKQVMEGVLSQRDKEVIVVNTLHELKSKSGKLGQEAVVKKYGFIFKYSAWFKYDGQEWVRQ